MSLPLKVEGAALQRGDAFGGQVRAAVDQPRVLGAVLHRAARDLVVVGLVGLTQVRGVGVGDGALLAHPQQRGAGVEAAGKGDADLLDDGEVLEDGCHGGGRGSGPGLRMNVAHCRAFEPHAAARDAVRRRLPSAGGSLAW